MNRMAPGGMVFLVIALVIVLAACATVPSLFASHVEGSDACCGAAECSALTMSFLGVLVLTVVAFAPRGRARHGRPAALQPIPPPPEPLLLGAA